MAVQKAERGSAKIRKLACFLGHQALSVLKCTTIMYMHTYMGRRKQLPSLLAQIGGLQ